MDTLLYAVLSNAAVTAVLAVMATGFGRISRRPALVHSLWIIVLLKLLTPPLWPVQLSWLVRSQEGPVLTDAPAVEPTVVPQLVDTVPQLVVREQKAVRAPEEMPMFRHGSCTSEPSGYFARGPAHAGSVDVSGAIHSGRRGTILAAILASLACVHLAFGLCMLAGIGRLPTLPLSSNTSLHPAGGRRTYTTALAFWPNAWDYAIVRVCGLYRLLFLRCCGHWWGSRVCWYRLRSWYA